MEQQQTGVATTEPDRPKLGLYGGITTIVGLIVGSGIFSTSGQSQKEVGSPGLALVFLALSGLLALTGSLW